MSEQIEWSIERLQAWIRDFGHDKQPAFIADLEAVLALARRTLAAEAKLAEAERREEDRAYEQRTRD